MKLIHSDVSHKERGWIETTTFKYYYLDETTGDVLYRETENHDNPYKRVNSYEDRQTEKRVLKPHEIPEEVRKKLNQLLGKKI